MNKDILKEKHVVLLTEEGPEDFRKFVNERGGSIHGNKDEYYYFSGERWHHHDTVHSDDLKEEYTLLTLPEWRKLVFNIDTINENYDIY